MRSECSMTDVTLQPKQQLNQAPSLSCDWGGLLALLIEEYGDAAQSPATVNALHKLRSLEACTSEDDLLDCIANTAAFSDEELSYVNSPLLDDLVFALQGRACRPHHPQVCPEPFKIMDPDEKLPPGLSCLERAVISRNCDAVQFVLSRGPRPHPHAANALFRAAQYGLSDIASKLIDPLVLPPEMDRSRPIPEYLGTRTLRWFANCSDGSDVLTRALLYAAEHDHVDFVRYLITPEVGANIHQFRDEALCRAVQRDCFPLVSLCMEHGCSFQVVAAGMAREVAQHGSVAMVQLLIKETPVKEAHFLPGLLKAAAEVNRLDVLQLLILQNGLVVDRSCYEAAAASITHGYLDCLRLLLDNGTPIRPVDAARLAKSSEQPRVMDLLVEKYRADALV